MHNLTIKDLKDHSEELLDELRVQANDLRQDVDVFKDICSFLVSASIQVSSIGRYSGALSFVLFVMLTFDIGYGKFLYYIFYFK